MYQQRKNITPEDVREAYSVVLYCSANAEGNIGDEEIIFIDCLFQTMSIFKNYDSADYLQTAEKIIITTMHMSLLREALIT